MSGLGVMIKKDLRMMRTSFLLSLCYVIAVSIGFLLFQMNVMIVVAQFSVFLAIFCVGITAYRMISKEFDYGSATHWLTIPSRWKVLLSKYLALAILILVVLSVSYLMNLAIFSYFLEIPETWLAKYELSLHGFQQIYLDYGLVSYLQNYVYFIFIGSCTILLAVIFSASRKKVLPLVLLISWATIESFVLSPFLESILNFLPLVPEPLSEQGKLGEVIAYWLVSTEFTLGHHIYFLFSLGIMILFTGWVLNRFSEVK
ncbi:hypothetical protein [Risungbinella massiliensis]|uniref:hypothetical protein n=1 Tax=Risungbinella massiliensis TaxID=1329796 RepID=UPI0005CBB28C|nr:hypothetical protein [Risungbinella massiliensis]